MKIARRTRYTRMTRDMQVRELLRTFDGALSRFSSVYRPPGTRTWFEPGQTVAVWKPKPYLVREQG